MVLDESSPRTVKICDKLISRKNGILPKILQSYVLFLLKLEAFIVGICVSLVNGKFSTVGSFVLHLLISVTIPTGWEFNSNNTEVSWIHPGMFQARLDHLAKSKFNFPKRSSHWIFWTSSISLLLAKIIFLTLSTIFHFDKFPSDCRARVAKTTLGKRFWPNSKDFPSKGFHLIKIVMRRRNFWFHF